MKTENKLNKLYQEIQQQEEEDYNKRLMIICLKEKKAIKRFMSIFSNYITYDVMEEYLIIKPDNWKQHKEIIREVFIW